MSLPAADDLFRPTVEVPVAKQLAASFETGVEDQSDGTSLRANEVAAPARRAPAKHTAAAAERPSVKKATVSTPAAESTATGGKKSSGRVRHDEKMTVYVTSDELLDLEHTRLMLRRSNGLAVDRGRIVREAVAMVLADFEANGDESALVKRLLED